MGKMILTNTKTNCSKVIKVGDFSPDDLWEIYVFYTNHKDYTVITKF